jgi:tetratricopeptide (TPR) repeat protein
MGEWCNSNLRDCQAWKDEGLEISTTSNECAKLYDATLRQLVSWIDCKELGGIIKTSKAMLEADPTSVIARCMAFGAHSLSTSVSIEKDSEFGDKIKKLVKDAETGNANKREKHHAKAVYYFSHGDMWSACAEWEKILAEYPNDLMAVKFAHDGYFFLGDSHRKKDSVERVLPKWNKSAPCYSYLHGMYAFGLEECGFYEKAEREARFGLEQQPQDCWSTHAIAHCMEMNGKFDEGIEFMESTVTNWEPCFILACHNFWHNSLFYIEKGNYEAALTLYDQEIYKRTQSNQMLDIVDAASLLARLEMEGCNVGKRWEDLSPLAENHIGDHVLAFNDSHLSMIVSRLEDEKLLKEHQKSLRNFVKTGTSDNHRITRDIGEQISDAIIAFNSKNFDKAFECLYPIRFEIIQIGGSHAQRDVYALLLIHSALRSKNPEINSKTKQLIDERNAFKKNSPLADRLLAHQKRVLSG